LDDFLFKGVFFQSLSPFISVAIVLLNQKKKINYFFQIYKLYAPFEQKKLP